MDIFSLLHIIIVFDTWLDDFYIKRFKKRNSQIKSFSLNISKAGLFIIFICMIIGTYEAYNPVVRYELISTNKITAPMRIVFGK